jgi:hypothetical protein
MPRLTLLYIITIEIGFFLHLFAIELPFLLQPLVIDSSYLGHLIILAQYEKYPTMCYSLLILCISMMVFK